MDTDFDLVTDLINSEGGSVEVAGSNSNRFRFLTVTPDGTRVYVTSPDAVSVISTELNQVSAQFQLPGKPSRMTFLPDGSRALLARPGVSQVASNTVVSDISVDDLPFTMVTTRSGDRVVMIGKNGLLATVDANTLEVVSSVDTELQPAGLTLDLTDTVAFVTDGDIGNVIRVPLSVQETR